MLGEIRVNSWDKNWICVKYQISGLDLPVKYIMIDLLLSITVYTKIHTYRYLLFSLVNIAYLFSRFMYQSYNLIEVQSYRSNFKFSAGTTRSFMDFHQTGFIFSGYTGFLMMCSVRGLMTQGGNYFKKAFRSFNCEIVNRIRKVCWQVVVVIFYAEKN